MEITDPSNFSVHGKAIFSENPTSEVPMGDPNTASEKKQKSKQENKKAKKIKK